MRVSVVISERIADPCRTLHQHESLRVRQHLPDKSMVSDTEIEPNRFSALEEDFCVGEDSGMIVSEEQRCRPVCWNTGDVESVGVCYQIFRPRCGVVHGEIVDGLFTGFNHMVERLSIVN